MINMGLSRTKTTSRKKSHQVWTLPAPLPTSTSVAHYRGYGRECVAWLDLEENFSIGTVQYIGPVRFAEKTNRNAAPANLLCEKNTVPAKKNKLKNTDYKRNEHGHKLNVVP